ncbi:MAG TPA: hypothetical protein VKR56_01375 [Candidatus Cybelea sp.]|nr:hypothetical protein [Candidatus Cybelea sp.]
MRVSVLTAYALGASVAAVILAGCGGAIAPQTVHGIAAPASATRGIYVGLGFASTKNTILGYPLTNQKNRGPMCSETPGVGTGDISVDGKGNLMVATLGGDKVIVFLGPAMCGSRLGAIDTALVYDAASADAENGKIVVVNFYTSTGGNVAVCTLSGGCTTTLTNPDLAGPVGVAVAKNGDCWASGYGSASYAVLVYFKKCAGSGQIATGFENAYPGGLDIDRHGNLVSVDIGQGFWVYRGCNPNCKRVGGPFAYEGSTTFGHLNETSTQFAAADVKYGQIDVYRYAPSKMVYEYSFNNAMSKEDSVTGAAYNPGSKE